MTQQTGKKKTEQPPNEIPESADDPIELRLYVTNRTPRCITAYDNLVRICGEHADCSCRITVIDLEQDPGAARREQIIAVPTLVRETKRHGRKTIVGTLSDAKKVAGALELDFRRRGYEPAPA